MRGLPGGEAFRAAMNAIEEADAQWRAVAAFFDGLEALQDRLPAAAAQPQDEHTTEQET